MITAVTAQNTRGVTAWTAVTPDLIEAQLDAVASDLRPAAVKSGMLGDARVVAAVADGVRRHRLAPYVLDPVMVATSGDPLLEPDAVARIRDELAPLAALLTPNLDEARMLLGRAVRSADEMADAARELRARTGARAVLLKGGHLAGSETVDVLEDGDLVEFRHVRIETRSTHGTGCALSASVAARLSLGTVLREAVRDALDWVHAAIAGAPALGGGHGPLDLWAPVVGRNALR